MTVSEQPGADLTPAIEAAATALVELGILRMKGREQGDGTIAAQVPAELIAQTVIEAAAPILLAELERQRDEADGAWHSVWLHGIWRSLTKRMTTEEKNAAADAVERHWAAMEAADGEATHEASRLALRWWDTEQCHCGHRQEQHRPLYGGWTVAELVDPFGGRCKDCGCVRYRLTYVAPAAATAGQHAGQAGQGGETP